MSKLKSKQLSNWGSNQSFYPRNLPIQMTQEESKCSAALRIAQGLADDIYYLSEQGKLNPEDANRFLEQTDEINKILEQGDCPAWVSSDDYHVGHGLSVLPSRIEDALSDTRYIAENYLHQTNAMESKSNQRRKRYSK
ncbi:MAG: hypothetical protein Sylvanvirus15_19 [Sylvanvirus sp.]|uniref:Uncharacterized protein n=1 Tax=Sylvanvirus sp. TaxID=2487774 RepID=A0A3G5AIC6_9VIRU|nr:MAG: hypothetical protein Sylvanvirus15_19 [Sylvanvirus sp.]